MFSSDDHMAQQHQQSGQNNHNNSTVTEAGAMNSYGEMPEKSNYHDNHGNNNDFTNNTHHHSIVTPCFCAAKSDYNCSCGDARQMKQRANTTVSVLTDVCKINMDDSMTTDNICIDGDGGDDGKRHRYMSAERFQSFSDAVFATVTTFMVCIMLTMV